MLSFLTCLFIGTRVECGHVQEICGKGQPGKKYRKKGIDLSEKSLKEAKVASVYQNHFHNQRALYRDLGTESNGGKVV